MQALTIQQIKANFPNEWILVGNPDLGDLKTSGSIASRLVSGIVLFHSKDKREVAYNAKSVKEGYKLTLLYTGELPKNRKFWL